MENKQNQQFFDMAYRVIPENSIDTSNFYFEGALLPEDCEWSDWGPWTQCSITCSRTPKSLSSDSRLSGEVLQDVGTQQRIRTIKKQAKYGGTPCDELRDGVQLIRCRAETPCSTKPNTIATEQPFFEYEGRKCY